MNKNSRPQPSPQRVFVIFTVFFVVAVAILLVLNSKITQSPPPASSNQSLPHIAGSQVEISGEQPPESSWQITESGDFQESSAQTDESSESVYESSEIIDQSPAESSEAADYSDVATTSSEESLETSDESSEIPYDGDLPYNPNKYMSLTRQELTPSELDAFFDDSLFIGNSLMVHFKLFVDSTRAYNNKNFLGNSKFLCASGLSAKIDLSTSSSMEKYLPKYQGEYVHTWEAAAKIKPKTVYYNLMGLNELGLHASSKSAQNTFENNVKVLEKIREACPGVKIVVLSSTYMVGVNNFNSEKNSLNNRNMSMLNSLMLEWCNQNGHDFIDVSTPFLKGDAMDTEYCMDHAKPYPQNQGCHIKQAYYPCWGGILMNYAYQKQNGTWKNPEDMPILKAYPHVSQ